VEIDEEEAVGILERLGCVVVARDPGSVTVTAPGHRTDLGREADLIEEVLRIHGYDRVPDNPAFACFPVERNPMEEARVRVQDLLRGFGYQEARTLSFGDPDPEGNPSAWTEEPPLRVVDPVRPELAGLRRGVLRNLIDVKRMNLDRGVDRVRLFEMGLAYLPQGEGALPDEKEVLGIVADADPLDVKGLVEALIETLGCGGSLGWRPWSFSLFREGASWECLLDDDRIGVLGALSSAALQGCDPRKAGVTAAEIDLGAIVAHLGGVRRFEPLPRLPGARRDISLVVDESVTWGQVEQVLQDLREPLLRGIDLFDLYRGKQVPAGKKNFAFGLTYRSDEKTLSGDEVESARQRAIAALQEHLGGEIRG
jgi:phenylalanyl-tRNA synthetase beta chain